MTLAASGAISIGGSTASRSINLELGRAAGATSSLGESTLRTLAGVGSGAIDLQDFYGKTSFSPVTYDLDSGTTSLTIPTGATGYEIWVLGGGGGGGRTSLGEGGGGGGGGVAYRSGSILSGEWGASITRSVGAAGASETLAASNDATAGGNSTLSATLGGVSVSMTGNGGDGTTGIAGAFGGSASGGSSNTSGSPGTFGEEGFPGDGGAPGIDIGGSGQGFGSAGEGGVAYSGRIRVTFT